MTPPTSNTILALLSPTRQPGTLDGALPWHIRPSMDARPEGWPSGFT